MSLHTVFCAECNTNFDWKSAGVFYSHRVSGMKGPITRLLACSKAALAAYPDRALRMGPTFVHPDYFDNPHNNESSGSYNKPASVMHWTREANIRETYVLFIDADMLLRAPIDPVALGARRGLVVSEHVPYLDMGIRHGLPQNFISAAAARLSKAAGWYHVFHLEDLRTIAPRWLHYTEQMRSNPQLYWRINGSIPRDIPTGDDYVHFGEAPWISEMYGYVFGAAEQSIDTKLTRNVVAYADALTPQPFPIGPLIIHYGLHCHVDDYHFTKYDYPNFNINRCGRHFFRPPARPRSAQALCAETVNTLNDALCAFYREQCPGSERLACPPHVARGAFYCEDADEHCEALKAAGHCGDAAVQRKCRRACTGCCGDAHPNCRGWAFSDECENNPAFMSSRCKGSCGLCNETATRVEEALSSSTAAAQAAAQASAKASARVATSTDLDTSVPASRRHGRPRGSAPLSLLRRGQNAQHAQEQDDEHRSQEAAQDALEESAHDDATRRSASAARDGPASLPPDSWAGHPATTEVSAVGGAEGGEEGEEGEVATPAAGRRRDYQGAGPGSSEARGEARRLPLVALGETRRARIAPSHSPDDAARGSRYRGPQVHHAETHEAAELEDVLRKARLSLTASLLLAVLAAAAFGVRLVLRWRRKRRLQQGGRLQHLIPPPGCR